MSSTFYFDEKSALESGEGFCYVIIFSNGTVKAGKTENLLKRFSQHKSSGIRFGASIDWVLHSVRHADYDNTEKSILSEMANISTRITGEYFSGIPLEKCLEIAEETGVSFCCSTSVERYRKIVIKESKNANLAKPGQLTHLKKIREWAGQTQAQAANDAGVKQGSWSQIESGRVSIAQRSLERYIETRTPTVLFLTGDHALLVAHAMLAAGHVAAICTDTSALDATLRTGAHIAIVGCDITECRRVIELATTESGLLIPVRGIDIGEDRITSINP